LICRDATAQDIPWLIRTTLDSYTQVFAPLLPECNWASFDAARLRGRFDAQLARVRVILADGDAGHPVGFANIGGTHIDMFFVARDHTSRGVGAALLADVEQRGARGLECFARNTVARRFYERHGWRLSGTHERLFAGATCTFVSYETSPLADGLCDLSFFLARPFSFICLLEVHGAEIARRRVKAHLKPREVPLRCCRFSRLSLPSSR
jgi:putative acetyltransferase